MKTPALIAVLVVAAAPIPAAGSDIRISIGAVDLPRLEQPPAFEDFLDMEADGEVERRMARIDNFVQWWPREDVPPGERTVAYLGYDNSHLYVIFVAFDRDPEAIRARLSPRDGLYSDDRVFVWLDTFADARRAIVMGVNPLGVQADFTWTDPDLFDAAYDVVFDSNAALTDRGYVAWLAIPFRSLRFPRTGDQHWRLMLERTIAHRDEAVFWPRLSNAIDGRLRQFGDLRGMQNVSPGRAIQAVPYLTWSSEKLPAVSGGLLDSVARLGVDAKAVVRDSLVIDATVRPDFSQIESDEPQLLANERFELAVTERRPFFLENAALFQSTSVSDRLQLFFSRRIVQPDAGARLTGRLGRWTLGALATGTGASTDGAATPHPASLDAVAIVGRDLPRRSDLRLFTAVRRTDQHTSTVVATEGRATLSSTWSASGFMALSGVTDRSAANRPTTTGAALAAELSRSGSSLALRTRSVDIGNSFRNDLGYTPRSGVRAVDQEVRWFWRPGGRIASHGPLAYAEHITDRVGSTDWKAEVGYELALAGPTTLRITRGRNSETFQGRVFGTTRNEVRVETSHLSWLSTTATMTWGTAVNHAPTSGHEAHAGNVRTATATVTLRPARNVRVDQLLLATTLRSPGGDTVVSDRAWRLTLAWQWTRRLGMRAIADYRFVGADPSWSALANSGRLTTDLLVSYRVRPGTELYLGYAESATADPDEGRALHQRGRRLFVKVGYLLRP
jgi:hypothetical protein